MSATGHAPPYEWGCAPEDYLHITCLALRMHFLVEAVLDVVPVFLGQSSKVYI